MPADDSVKRGGGLNPVDVGLSIVIIVFLGILLFLFVIPRRARSYHYGSGEAQNVRQVGLAAIMYGGDYDDGIPLAINGRWSRLQNRHDSELTINCPGPGTQDFPSPDAAGAKPTRTWVQLQMEYVRSMGLL